MFNIKEDDNQKGDENPDDSDKDDSKAQEEAEKMFQLEEQEANEAYEEPREEMSTLKVKFYGPSLKKKRT